MNDPTRANIQRLQPSSLIPEKELPERAGTSKTWGIDPHDGTRWDIRVSNKRMDLIVKRSVGQAEELAHVMPQVLQCPDAIFQGLREEGEDDWLCYCGTPDCAYTKEGAQTPGRPGQVYLVFVNADRVAYRSWWEKWDDDNHKNPCNYETRFRKQVL